MSEMIKLTIDGVEMTVEKGTTVLAAARMHNIDIPTLCHDDLLDPYGACGLCVVEAEGIPKLLRSCATLASDGMVIKTHSDRIDGARRFALQMLLSDHRGDCKAPCNLSCPANTDCQGYVGLIANGEYEQAVKVMKDNLPIPACIGRICPHPCEKNCRRALVDEPISIASLKYFAADIDLNGDTYIPDSLADTDKKIAVIGGGPGGLSSAYFLRRLGHSVTVFDMMPKMGGMLRYGIPEYRLPNEIVDKEVEIFAKMGIALKNNVKLGKDITLDELRKQYDAVVLAVGAWTSGKMRVKGEDSVGVLGGIDFLREIALGNKPEIGDRVAVCGGGNTAMDACRSAVRFGAKKVYVIYRRTRDEMPAEKLEIDEAIEEGVDFRFLCNPDEILTENGKVSGARLQLMELGEPDAGGRRSPVPIDGKFENIELDTVIMAIGQKLNSTGLDGVELTKRGTVAADETTYLTNLDGVFAIGDATNKGADIAISAIGEARRSAVVIDGYLRDNMKPYERPYVVEKEVTPEMLADKEKQPRAKMPVMAPEVRNKSFKELALGFDEETAKKEAARCLECGCQDYYKCKLLKYSREYHADPSDYMGAKESYGKDTSHTFILHDNDKCILCGLCVRVCGEVMGSSTIALSHRGFVTVVTPEFGKTLDMTNCTSCGECVQLCPTGSLTAKVPFKKTIPLIEKPTLTICNGCAVGCTLRLYSVGSTLTRVEAVDGVICGEGRFAFGAANRHDRLLTAQISGKTASLESALKKANELIAAHAPANIAVAVSEKMCDEELEAAKALAERIGCKAISLGKPKKSIKHCNADEIQKLFGEKFNLSANAETVKKLGFTEDKPSAELIICLEPELISEIKGANAMICLSANESDKADVKLPAALIGEFDGTLRGNAKLAKAKNPPFGYSNAELISMLAAK